MRRGEIWVVGKVSSSDLVSIERLMLAHLGIAG